MISGSSTDNDTDLLKSIDPFHSNDEADGFNFGKYFLLRYDQRLCGFGIFCAFGIILTLIGTVMMFTLSTTGFAVAYTSGNVSMILATLFLSGPVKQIKDMCNDQNRILAVIIYFLMIFITLITAFITDIGFLCVFLMIIQIYPYLWYTITSIPKRQTVGKCCCYQGVADV